MARNSAGVQFSSVNALNFKSSCPTSFLRLSLGLFIYAYRVYSSSNSGHSVNSTNYVMICVGVVYGVGVVKRHALAC